MSAAPRPPVPITPMVTRSDGATAPAFPKAEDGITVGKPNVATPPRPRFKNVRREELDSLLMTQGNVHHSTDLQLGASQCQSVID